MKFSSSMIFLPLRRRCRGFGCLTFLRGPGNGDNREGCGGDPKATPTASGHPLSFGERDFWMLALRDSDRFCRFFLRFLWRCHHCCQESRRRCRRRRRRRCRRLREGRTGEGSLRAPALLLSRRGASASGAGARKLELLLASSPRPRARNSLLSPGSWAALKFRRALPHRRAY